MTLSGITNQQLKQVMREFTEISLSSVLKSHFTLISFYLIVVEVNRTRIIHLIEVGCYKLLKYMKTQKKLAENISDSIQDKLGEPAARAEKLRKLIKKMAKKLAEEIVRIAVKQDKKAKKTKELTQAVTEAKTAKKQKIRTGLKGVDRTERESLLTEKTDRAIKKT